MALAMLLFFIEVIFISSHANNKFSLLVDKDDLFSLSNQAITGWVHTQTAVFPPLFIPAYQLKERRECLVGLGGGGYFIFSHIDIPEYASIGVTLICGQSKLTYEKWRALVEMTQESTDGVAFHTWPVLLCSELAGVFKFAEIFCRFWL